MTKKEFKKEVVIYKSHKLANGFISVTYALIIGNGMVSTEKTVKIKNKRGALASLFSHYCII